MVDSDFTKELILKESGEKSFQKENNVSSLNLK
jgi:hypothetical protein